MQPKSIYVEPTNICNLKCSFCFHASGAMRRKKGKMPLKLFKKLVSDVKPFKPYLVLHHSGESLVHSQLPEFIRCAKKAGLRVGLTTNGTLLTPAILDTGIDELNISLAGIDEQDYARVRPGASFASVMRNIEAVASEKARRHLPTTIAINVIRTKQNDRRLPAFLRRAKAIKGVDTVIVRRLMDWSGSVNVSGLRPGSQWLLAKASYLNKLARLFLKGSLCDAINSSAAVLWDGTVVPCCLDFNGTLAMGNIKNEKFLTIWNGPRANHIRKMLASVDSAKAHPTCGPCLFPAWA